MDQKNQPGEADVSDAVVVDARGYRCPMPVILMEAALRRLAPGDHLKVIADDPVAAVDIPHFCRVSGHRVRRLRKEESRAAQRAAIVAKTAKTAQNQPPNPIETRPGSTSICVFLVTRGENS